jgi:hypothetical protein
MSDHPEARDLPGHWQGTQDDIGRRIAEHQDWMALHPRPANLGGQPLNLLADGDSWFDYPLGGPAPDMHSDVIASLRGLLADGSTILSLAHFGDAAHDLMLGQKLIRFVTALNDAANGRFDAILFSGGGNDLAGDQFVKWLTSFAEAGGDPMHGLNEAALAGVLDDVRGAYLSLIQTRDRLAPGAPIFGHGYDFAWPTGKGAPCGVGPWLRPSLARQGCMDGEPLSAVERGARIIGDMLSRFARMLAALAANPANNLVLVPTHAVLDPQTEWANELHPTPAGFAKVAGLFADALAARFPDRRVVPDRGVMDGTS